MLAPGDYQAYLLKEGSDVEYRNPEVLRTLGHGVPVHVEAGATVQIELREAQ